MNMTTRRRNRTTTSLTTTFLISETTTRDQAIVGLPRQLVIDDLHERLF